MRDALVQELAEYIIREPGSTYARDHAVTPNDVYNVAARIRPAPNKYDKDEVSLAR